MNERKEISNRAEVYLTKSYAINSSRGRYKKFLKVNQKYTNNVEKWIKP